MGNTKAGLRKIADDLKVRVLFENTAGEVFTEINRALLSEGNDATKITTHQYESLVEVAENAELAMLHQLSSNAAEEQVRNQNIIAGDNNLSETPAAPTKDKNEEVAKADVIPAANNGEVVPTTPPGALTPATVAAAVEDVKPHPNSKEGKALKAAAQAASGE